ncbi:hypothetical protein G7Y89_g1415 [Cudoniella acicularis]|uniref:NADP-dependent oxidoreductase domain-containing protein n=1 Tax=Cudoniella acicularis TaxID=354080 RepID=A0A8H4W9J9_9HELO|nr:hypothetical protein G7Y89_g1415 [Cudoniella acicularis]
MSQSKKPVSLILGAGNFNNDPAKVIKQREILEVARKHNITVLDTSRHYEHGESETFLGNENLAAEFEIITKAEMGLVPGGSSKEGILKGWEESAAALKTEKVPVYLLHVPDDKTPIAETMEGIQALYLAGKFDQFGLSNFSPEQTEECYNHMKSKGYILPTIYQSIYGPIARLNESTLFPLLRRLNITIQAYSPLASGFLSKTPAEILDGKGHFNPSTILGKILQEKYGKPVFLDYLEKSSSLDIASLPLLKLISNFHKAETLRRLCEAQLPREFLKFAPTPAATMSDDFVSAINTLRLQDQQSRVSLSSRDGYDDDSQLSRAETRYGTSKYEYKETRTYQESTTYYDGEDVTYKHSASSQSSRSYGDGGSYQKQESYYEYSGSESGSSQRRESAYQEYATRQDAPPYYNHDAEPARECKVNASGELYLGGIEVAGYDEHVPRDKHVSSEEYMYEEETEREDNGGYDEEEDGGYGGHDDGGYDEYYYGGYGNDDGGYDDDY